MSVLITGNLSILAGTLAIDLSRERNKVVLAGRDIDLPEEAPGNIATHSIAPWEPLFEEVFAGHKFDAVIFLPYREEHFLIKPDINAGEMLDGLNKTLDLCRANGVPRVLLLSSPEVYGHNPDTSEYAIPRPASINGHTLIAAERFCSAYQTEHGLQATIIRIPFLYALDEEGTLLSHLIQEAHTSNRLALPGVEGHTCSFLHAGDVSGFIIRALSAEYNPEARYFNLSSADPMTFGELAELLRASFPDASVEYEDKGQLFTMPSRVLAAKSEFDWIAEHKLETELPAIVDSITSEPTKKGLSFDAIRAFFAKYGGVIVWVELLMGALVMQFLNNLTGTLLQFNFIDFRLLYVVLMGSVHGIRIGLLASVLAILSGWWSWSQLGLDTALLVYNIENWLPFGMYLLAGGVTGYVHDKNQNDASFKDEQIELLHEKYTFLYGVHNDIRKVTNQFRAQLVGYRDSFGRIYSVVSELDTLQEEDVFLKAVSVLEDIMDNESISIYALDSSGNYGRLLTYSSALDQGKPKSLQLADYPELKETIDQGGIFQNTEMLPNHPAYFATILDGQEPVAAVVIWSAKFDQFTKRYYNLFGVLCGLIQSSLVRAASFMNANTGKFYIPGTRILKRRAFLEVLRIKSEMKKKKIAEYQLLRLDLSRKELKDKYGQLAKLIRQVDYVGSLREDENYLLLTQSEKVNVKKIAKRIKAIGVDSSLVGEEEITNGLLA
jgi:UDP-glucose 4-epimerase